jgi:lipopolysaccharide transport system permease protein
MMTQVTEYIIDSGKRKIFDLKELWQYRELFYFFTWRDLKVKYKQTTLGVFWVVLQPVLTVVIFSLFFGKALNVPSGGLPYPVFVFSGLLLWTVFSSSVSSAGNSMLSNAAIIKKIYFPRIIIPVVAILVSIMDFCIAFVVFIAVLIFYDVHIDVFRMLIFWPSAIVMMIAGTLGISCWLAALNVKYRDIRYVIPFGLQVALFVSPVIYPFSILNNDWINYILALNPMFGVITMFRIPLIGVPEEIHLIFISVASTVVFLMAGVFYFKRTEAYFADIA